MKLRLMGSLNNNEPYTGARHTSYGTALSAIYILCVTSSRWQVVEPLAEAGKKHSSDYTPSALQKRCAAALEDGTPRDRRVASQPIRCSASHHSPSAQAVTAHPRRPSQPIRAGRHSPTAQA
eukprot:1928806-Prymnesium_polylepis.1